MDVNDLIDWDVFRLIANGGDNANTRSLFACYSRIMFQHGKSAELAENIKERKENESR
jgi:hypothetical protein